MTIETLPDQRELFDLPHGVTYLICAYMAPQLRSVTETGRRAVARKAHPWEIGSDDFFSDVEALRSRFAALVGGDVEGVAVMPSVSYGVSTAAAQLDVPAGADIVLLADQFPSNVYPWRELAARTGARIRTVPRPADDDWTAALLDTIGERTAVVAVPPCHWTDGTVVDLVRGGAAARRVGAAFVVDGTQAVGAVPVDVEVVRPDFLLAAAITGRLARDERMGALALWNEFAGTLVADSRSMMPELLRGHLLRAPPAGRRSTAGPAGR